MWGSENKRTWWSGRKARLRSERGVAMAEYVSILAVIALVVLFGLAAMGNSVSDALGGADCQAGGDWTKQPVWAVDNGDKKQALDEDQKGNGDGWVCTKNPNGGGNGNQGNNSNIMENNT